MKTYEIEKHFFGDCLIRTDGQRISIPFVAGNPDYDEYVSWVAEGNTAVVTDLRPTQAQKDSALAKKNIANLEAGQHRAIREAVLTGDKTRLQLIESQIAAERLKL